MYETNVILLEDIYSDIKLKTPLSNYKDPYGKSILLLQKRHTMSIVYQIEQNSQIQSEFFESRPSVIAYLTKPTVHLKLDLIYTYTKTPYPKETERSYKYRIGFV